MITTLLLALALAAPPTGISADTTKAQPPRPSPTTGSAPKAKPAPRSPAKPVGEPVLKRRQPPD